MYHVNIKLQTIENEKFRKVVKTGKFSQLVLMAIPVGGEIGEEIHSDTDQILILVEGNGEVIMEGISTPFNKHDLVFVPSGTKHNFLNTGTEVMKLFTIYSPPHHPDKLIQEQK